MPFIFWPLNHKPPCTGQGVNSSSVYTPLLCPPTSKTLLQTRGGMASLVGGQGERDIQFGIIQIQTRDMFLCSYFDWLNVWNYGDKMPPGGGGSTSSWCSSNSARNEEPIPSLVPASINWTAGFFSFHSQPCARWSSMFTNVEDADSLIFIMLYTDIWRATPQIDTPKWLLINYWNSLPLRKS